MKSPAARLMNFLRDEGGAAAAEYGMLIAALVVLVALAAATAHGLGENMHAWDLERIETALDYQIWHGLALLGTAALAARATSILLWIAACGFGLGSLLFSGCLYLLAYSGLDYFSYLPPFGGLAFIAGWLALAGYGWRLKAGKAEQLH